MSEQPVRKKNAARTSAPMAGEDEELSLEDLLALTPEEPVETQDFDFDLTFGDEETNTPEPVYARPQYQPQTEEMYEDGVEEEEEEEEEKPSFFARYRKVMLVCLCSLILLTLIGTIVGIVYLKTSDPYDNKILNNVSVAGINLGGMTKEEAYATIELEYGDLYSETDMVVTISDTVLTFSPRDTGADLDVDAVVKDAYNYGRTGTKAEKEAAYQSSLVSVHTIGLLPYLNLNDGFIRSVLEEYASGFESVFTESSYQVEGDMPKLNFEDFDANAPTQILRITLGTPGMGVDVDSLFNEIMDAYSMRIFAIQREEATPDAVPEMPDLQAIYDSLYVAPVNADINKTTFEPIPGDYGYDFDLEAAEALLAEAAYGETFEISMRYLEPDIMDDEVLFRDVLGSCQTKHTNDEDRNTNLKIACAAINDTILMPGETFSFNDHLGERTEEKGYKPAGTYAGTKLIDSIGGGICQCSSTLYYCTLLADLEIVDRINHGLPVTYMEYGMDATVSWGGPDFQFRNNSNFPIKLKAEVSDGYVKMQILGTDEKDYYVKMEYEFTGWEYHETVYEEHDKDSGYYDGQVLQGGSDGIYVKTYKCKYNKDTNELISRDFEARSHYKRVDKVVVRIVDSSAGTQPTQPAPTEPAPTEPAPTQPAPTEPAPTEPAPTQPPETTPPPEPTQPPAPAEGGEG